MYMLLCSIITNKWCYVMLGFLNVVFGLVGFYII